MVEVKAFRVIFVASGFLEYDKTTFSIKNNFICDFEKEPSDSELLNHANGCKGHGMFEKIVLRQTFIICLKMPFERFYRNSDVEYIVQS